MRLDIGRMTLDCLLPAGHGDAAGVQLRAEALAKRLPEHLAPRLAAPGEGGGTVMIRELSFDITLDLDCPPELAIEVLGDSLLRAIARKLAVGNEGQVRFASAAEHLSVFMCDLMDGDAWSLWYHMPFDGLRHLSVPRALATLVARDLLTALAAIGQLETWRVEQLASCAGVEMIAVLVADAEKYSDDTAVPSETTVLLMWNSARQASASFESAFLAALAASQGAGNPSARPAITLARELAVAARRSRGRAGGEDDIAGHKHRHTSLFDLTAPPQVLAAVGRAIQHGGNAGPHLREGTRFGGLFLLLRDLDDMTDVLPQHCPSCGDLEAAQALRVSVLAALSGEKRAAAWFKDDVWRQVMGLDRSLTHQDLLAWAEAAAPPDWLGNCCTESVGAAWITGVATAVMKRFSRRLPGFGESSPDHLRRNFLDSAASVVHGEDCLVVEIDRPPLDPILALSGAGDWEDCFSWTVPFSISVMRRR